MSKKSRTAGRNILHKWVQHFADGHYHKQYRISNFCFLPIILCKFCILVRLYINLEIVMCLGTLGIISLCPLKLQCLFFFLSKDTRSNKITFCSAWLRLKLNTKMGLNHPTPPHHLTPPPGTFIPSFRHARKLKFGTDTH